MNAPSIVYRPVDRGFAVKEAFNVKIGGGSCRYDLQIVSRRSVCVMRVRHHVESVGVAVLHPDQAGFLVPLSNHGDCRVNGDLASNSAIYMPGDLDSVHVRGGPRENIGVVVSREELVQTLAALRGVGPEDIKLQERVIEMPAARSATLRRRVSALLNDACASAERSTGRDPLEEIFSSMCDAYLSATSEPLSTHVHGQRPDQIVRRAEERFAAAAGSPVSLADLCAAAGVGKSRLYQAFHRVCGEPPLSYFRKRQLMDVRAALVDAEPLRGGVKRAALDAGLTSFGRFAVEYRQLFGESPSATLNRTVV